jgi:hypothetical protein
MNGNELNYIISQDGTPLIGATENIDWIGAKIKLVGDCLHIKKDKELLFFENITANPDLFKAISNKKEIILSYIFNDLPEFINITVIVE